jgi:N-acetylmuramoyl-L-alanine amidase, family 3
MYMSLAEIHATRYIRASFFCLFFTLILAPLQMQAQRLFTVVIDAGHGGKDSGTVGNGGKEKDITLAVALLVGKKISAAHPEVRVLYTRSTDVFVGLQARADFANKHKASMMLSIHVNSAPSRDVYGTETYVLGIAKFANNLSVAMRENKAMLLESNYKTTYRGFDPTSTESYIMFDLMQDAYFNKSIELANKIQRQYRASGRYSRGVRQDILWVLSQSAMPSVLTEIGFLSNASEAAFMLSDAGQQAIASSIAAGFSSYYRTYRGKSPRIKEEKESDSVESKRRDEEPASSSDSFAQPTAEQESPRSSSVERSSRKRQVQEQEKSNTSDNDKSKKSREEKADAQGITYRVQFLSSPDKIDTEDTRFRKLPTAVERVKVAHGYLYLLAPTTSKVEAQKQLRALPKTYRDAYIVRYRGKTRL